MLDKCRAFDHGLSAADSLYMLAFLLLDHEQGDLSEQGLLLLLAALEDCAADRLPCLLYSSQKTDHRPSGR